MLLHVARTNPVAGQTSLDGTADIPTADLVITIAEALATGRGVERPIRCPKHNDAHASASLNVLKRVWVCYACGESGKVDSKAIPKAEDLLAMMKPEEAARGYSMRWLSLFTNVDPAENYWCWRFPQWVCHQLHLGVDPVTGDPVFPVYTPQGRLAGITRRTNTEQKYDYPYNWSASRNLAGYAHAHTMSLPTDVVFLVEGQADQAALLEAGATAFGCYGSGLHHPQIELLNRVNPKLVVYAFDADPAGRKAAERSVKITREKFNTAVLDWNIVGANDPADTTVAMRLEAMVDTVRTSGYPHANHVINSWQTQAQRLAA